MKGQFATLCLVLAVTISVTCLAFGAGPKPMGYDPAQLYTGPFGPSNVYYRETFRAKWRLGIPGTYPNAVTCPEALSRFKVSGLWSGHLKLDGSCGIADEPSEWAVGNRLNYNALTSGGH